MDGGSLVGTYGEPSALEMSDAAVSWHLTGEDWRRCCTPKVVAPAPPCRDGATGFDRSNYFTPQSTVEEQGYRAGVEGCEAGISAYRRLRRGNGIAAICWLINTSGGDIRVYG